MNITLWIVAGVLAAVFLASGVRKLVTSRADLVAAGYGVLDDFSTGAVKTIGALEVLAAIGLVLPALLDIAPDLVSLAALGLVLLMIGATVAHLRRGEAKVVPTTLVLAAMASFVAWGRVDLQPFG